MLNREAQALDEDLDSESMLVDGLPWILLPAYRVCPVDISIAESERVE